MQVVISPKYCTRVAGSRIKRQSHIDPRKIMYHLKYYKIGLNTLLLLRSIFVYEYWKRTSTANHIAPRARKHSRVHTHTTLSFTCKPIGHNHLYHSIPNGTTAPGEPRPPSRVSSILPRLGRLLSSFYTLVLLHLPSLHLPSTAWFSLWGAFLLAH